MIQLQQALRRYYVFLFLALCILLSRYWQFIETHEPGVYLYAVLSSLGYAFIFLLPVVLLVKLATLLLRPGLAGQSSWPIMSVYAIAWLAGLVVVGLIFADMQLFMLYEYHFNSFVWNLLTTPGGLAALGATQETTRSLIGLGLLAGIGLIMVLAACHRSASPGRPAHSRRPSLTKLASLLFVTFLVTEGVYAYSRYTGQEPYLQAASVLPFQLKSTADRLFKRMGLTHASTNKLKVATGQVNYPLQPITSLPRDQYPDIIWLTAESFRWDLLDPQITPNLWAFAQKSMDFRRHYSGGNRTRMGMFSMFYGLNAPYWYAFEEQRVRPVMIDFLIEKGYRFSLRTSQSFTYPELNNTVFHDMPDGTLMEALQKGDAWERDRDNIDNMIAELEGSQRSDPRFMFMFLESTHAPYTFPSSAVIRPDYLREMNYAKLNLGANIDGIHDRYVNAAHYVDQQVGKLLDYLDASGRLDNTIVLFTGDHGEEFMENGHWGHGHNNYFPEQQIRVPLLLSVPGYEPQAVEHETSHLQIPLTIMQYLGVTTPPESYSLAGNLFAPPDYLVVGNYTYMGVKQGDTKISFPFKTADYFRYDVYGPGDKKPSREVSAQIVASKAALLDQVVQESRRFVREW